MNGLTLRTPEDSHSQINLGAQEHTVWLTQLEMAELFNAPKQNISLHLQSTFKDGELGEDSVVKKSLTTAPDGKKYQNQIITSNDFPLLTHAGTISHEQIQAQSRMGKRYPQLEQDFKRAEAIEANQQDAADLQALETQIK